MNNWVQRYVLGAASMPALLFGLACESDVGGGDGEGGDANLPTGGSGGTSSGLSCNEPGALSLSGVWAADLNMGVDLESEGGIISLCPADQVGDSRMTLVLKVDHDPSDPARITNIESHVCMFTLPAVTAKVGECQEGDQNFVRTVLTVPNAFGSVMPKLDPASITASLGAAEIGSSIAFDKLTFLAGSSAEALPNWDLESDACFPPGMGSQQACETECVSDCELLVDEDSDGYPGVTLHVCGLTPEKEAQGVTCDAKDPYNTKAILDGRAYLSLRVDPELSGTVKSSCEITGSLESGVNYELVGANIALLGSPIGVKTSITSLPAFAVNPAKSAFQMVRVDGLYDAMDLGLDFADGSAACETLLRRRNEVFE